MTTSSDPRLSTLAGVSDHNLLVLILTELRLHTYLLFQREVSEVDVENLRAEVMNDFDVVDSDATGTAFPANL